MPSLLSSNNYRNVEEEGLGYVYVISEAKPSDDLLAVKIGRTGGYPPDRLAGIQRSSSRNLRLVYAIRTKYNCLLEATAHALLRPLRRSDDSFGLDGWTELYEVSSDEALTAIIAAAEAIAEERHISLENDVFLGFTDYYELDPGTRYSAWCRF